jgi:hypothetical protein
MRRENNVEQKLTRARTHLLLNQPFFGSLGLRLKLSPGPVPTMATDGRRILYNPLFIESLNPAELEGTLAHEVMHVALAHHCRREEREPKTWNEAADYAVNPILVGNGFTLPAGALVDPSFDNLSAEEIYARLIQRPSGGSSEAPSPPQANPNGGAGQEPGNPSPSAPNSQPAGSCGSPPGQQPPQNTDGAPEDSPMCEDRPGGFGEVLDATDEDGNPASPAEKSRQEHEWAIAAYQALRLDVRPRTGKCGPASSGEPTIQARLACHPARFRRSHHAI